ncbi:sensor histidine kinase [Streptomyces endophyticus]|uniref:histidine kinase n=1 Tax=Streptomyces endophyticus TaxID=714166 RepID=A0ABU6EZM0_9ACTN|nr:sensor domain-containing protein [Streptomyces endophyticus]MEB8336106.1 sensor domain-containing protein [Streptomyces endophyticus]
MHVTRIERIERIARIKAAALAGARGLALSLLSLAGSLTLLVACIVSIACTVVGVGLFTTPPLLRLVRSHVDVRRTLAARWCGVTIPRGAYRPRPGDRLPGLLGQPDACLRLLRDPATWRDLRWLAADMTAGFATALLPAALVVYPIEGYVVAAGLWRVLGGGAWWYGFVPVSGQATALAAAVLATLIAVAGYYAAEPMLRVHFTLTRWLLAPRGAELRHRVEELARTRHDAVDASAAELRRIERDLHDGAQARLVAMGMHLGTVDALMESDPATARALLARARADSVQALEELRELVRGIYPPVLAERGLADAVRALALRMPVPVEPRTQLPGRPEAAVESAAYFATSEALTNAAKHAAATCVHLELAHHDGVLHIDVTDDGRGGADPEGSGLRGIARRLDAFDGTLTVHSPEGGPTSVTMEIPCRLLPPGSVA